MAEKHQKKLKKIDPNFQIFKSKYGNNFEDWMDPDFLDLEFDDDKF